MADVVELLDCIIASRAVLSEDTLSGKPSAKELLVYGQASPQTTSRRVSEHEKRRTSHQGQLADVRAARATEHSERSFEDTQVWEASTEAIPPAPAVDKKLAA